MTSLDLASVPPALAEAVTAALAAHPDLPLHVGPTGAGAGGRWWAVPARDEAPAALAQRLAPLPLPDAVLLPDEAARAAFEAASGPDLERRAWAGAEQLEPLLAGSFPDEPALLRDGRPLRVLVTGHDLNFLTRVVDHLQRLPQVDVVVDHVPVFARQDFARSRELLADRDVVWAEWLSPVAIWYSENVAPHQRLVVRCHRYELYNEWPSQLRIDRVAQVVCVSPHYARLARERNPSWPAEKVVCIPNYVDTQHFARAKHPGAPFALGMLGVVPRRKRLDLALDLLARLRRADDRFHLVVRSKMPWEYAWNWRDEQERTAITEVLRRVQADPLLRDAVVLDDHGPDVAAWLRGIGWVVSTSDDESFHLAPAEGMASGAVPVVRHWPGAETIYDAHWLHDDVEAMAARVLDVTRSGTWAREAAWAQGHAGALALEGVLADVRRVLVADLPTATTEGSLSARAAR